MTLVQTARLNNTNVVYSPSAYVFTILQPARLNNANGFYAAALAGGSPAPLPFHPFCTRGNLTVEEAPRGSMTVAEAPRNSMGVTTLPRKSLTPSC